MSHRWRKPVVRFAILAMVMSPVFQVFGASGSWTNTAGGNWSATNNWAGAIVADGAGSTAWFTNALPGSRSVTNDGISRTVGIVNVGAAGGLGSFTIVASAGLKLICSNNGASAQINQNSASKGDAISAPLALADSLEIANDSSTKPLILSGATITSVVAGARTVSNVSTGSGGVTISGNIGNGVGPVGVVQNSATCPLTLGGVNGFTNGLTIKSGAVIGIASANAFGATNNVITLGDTTGSQDTLLGCGSALTFVQPILVAGGNTGMASLTNTATVYFNGPVTLNNHALKVFSSGSSTVMGGGITGTGTLLIAAVSGSSGINITTAPVNHSGAITNIGVGPSAGLISGGVGSNVTAITEDSTNSALNITGLLSVNGAGTTLANNNVSGGALLAVSGGVRGAGDLVLNNNGALSNGITLMTGVITNTGRIINSGSGSGNALISAVIGTNVTGVVQNSGTSPLVLSGANSYPGGTEIVNGRLLVTNVTGSATGPGAVTIYNGGTLQGNGLIAGTVTNRHGGSLVAGFDGVPGATLTAGSLVWNGGGMFTCKIASLANNEVGAGIDYDQIVVTNTLTAVPGGSNLVIKLDSLGQTLAFQTNRNYSLKLITCGKSAVLNPSDVTLDTNAFLAGGTWSVTNLNNAIYVTCLGEVATNKNYWRGTGNWSTATNWSQGHAPLPGEDVEFDFQGVANCTADAVSNNLGSLTLAAGYTGTVTVLTKFPGQGAFANMAIAGDGSFFGGKLTHQANGATEINRLFLTVGGNLTIGPGGRIDADGKGHTPGNGPGKTSWSYSGGAGHGGMGAAHSGIPGSTYGSVTSPTNIGSSQLSNTGTGEGGGAVRLVVSGTATVFGVISASGISSHCAGSGGSIFLTTAALAGTGTLRANGGGGTAGGGAGGGGRIAVILTGATNFGGVKMETYTGSGKAGAAGTVYLESIAHSPGRGKLVVDGNGMGANYGNTLQNGVAPSSNDFSEIVLGKGAVYAVDTNDILNIANTDVIGYPGDRFDGILVAGGILLVQPAFCFSNYFVAVSLPNPTFNPAESLTVGTNATIKFDLPWTLSVPFTLEPGAWMSHSGNTTAEVYKLDLTINGNLVVPAGAEINVDSMGYTNGYGPGKTIEWAGAGHGGVGDGRGDSGTGQAAGRTYGSVTAPTNLGSGANNGPGGGAIRLTVTGTTTVNGVISAKGGRRDAYPYGVGAGGSVFLTTAVLAGNGTISANGADANENTTGGGGRIAVILTNSTDFGDVKTQAYPGLPSGAAGTVYLQTPAQGAGRGTLLIDAANRVPKFGSARTLVCSNVADAVVGTVIITNKAILALDTNQSLRVNGSWTNAASFVAAVGGTVEFAGDAPATIAGSNSFQNLIITNAGKVVSFQSGRTNLVAGLLKLGAAASSAPVTLQSSVDGSWWYVNLTTNAGGTQQIARVAVKDSHAGGGQLLTAAKGSVDGGHNVNWVFPRSGGTVILVQ